MTSRWSGATLTTNIDAGSTTSFGIGLGLEKPNYQINTTLRDARWTNASYTSLSVVYNRPFVLSKILPFPMTPFLRNIQLVPGAGSGLGYFSNDVNNASRVGLLFDAHFGVNKPLNKRWTVFSNLTYQYANIETQTTNALNNMHTVALKNSTFIELGVKYNFGVRLKPKFLTVALAIPEMKPPVVVPIVVPVIIPEPVIVSNNINGYVTDTKTGQYLENVKVKVFFNDKDLITYTDNKGHYVLPVNLKHLPGSFAMAFSLKGFVPVSKNITKKDAVGFSMNTSLEEESINTVVLELEPNLHHLGDGSFKGVTNSQFQVGVEGKAFEINFHLLAEHLTAKSGVITLQAKGLNHENKLLVNNAFVASMNLSPMDGSFGDLSYTFEPSKLVEGDNILTIMSVNKGNSIDHDDFEFTNVILRLSYD